MDIQKLLTIADNNKPLWGELSVLATQIKNEHTNKCNIL
jgi:hypothetical protein